MPAGEWFDEDNGLPYPRWDTINRWINANVEERDLDAGHDAAVRLWMDRLADAVDAGLTTAESPHFLLLSALEKSGRQWVLKTAEESRKRICNALGDLAWADSYGKHLLMVLEEGLYAHYVAHYHVSDYMGRSSGMMIPGDGFVHIAIVAPAGPEFDQPMRRVVAHEFSHHALHDLDLPRWLDEAIAMHFEDQLGGGEYPIADRLGPHFEVIGTNALLREFRNWWTEERMQGFWNGDLWNSEDDEQAFCYEMARIIFRILHQSINGASGPFRKFVGDARRADAGEKAAQRHLGCSLGDLAGQFLGDGDWSPIPGW